jgi:uncharacterized membrane protein YkoI
MRVSRSSHRRVGGTVIEAEVWDEGAGYGVEIRLNDGSVVDVALDANFHAIGDVSNDEGAACEEGAADQNGGGED